jgi:hypothetical protein
MKRKMSNIEIENDKSKIIKIENNIETENTIDEEIKEDYIIEEIIENKDENKNENNENENKEESKENNLLDIYKIKDFPGASYIPNVFSNEEQEIIFNNCKKEVLTNRRSVRYKNY